MSIEIRMAADEVVPGLMRAAGLKVAFFLVDGRSPSLGMVSCSVIRKNLVHLAMVHDLTTEDMDALQSELASLELAEDSSEVIARIVAIADPAQGTGRFEYRACDCPLPVNHGYIYENGVRISDKITFQMAVMGALNEMVSQGLLLPVQAANLFVQMADLVVDEVDAAMASAASDLDRGAAFAGAQVNPVTDPDGQTTLHVRMDLGRVAEIIAAGWRPGDPIPTSNEELEKLRKT